MIQISFVISIVLYIFALLYSIQIYYAYLNSHKLSVAAQTKQPYHPVLTHVVIPFHTKQLKLLQENLKRWKSPCAYSQGKQYKKAMEISQPLDEFWLVFYVNNYSDKAIHGQIKQMYQSMGEDIKACFKGFQIISADLKGEQDSYLNGSKNMWEKLVTNWKAFNFRKAAKIVAYFEPDTIPLQRNWLNLLYLANLGPSSNFWMKGSIFRGNSRFVKSSLQKNHINGNALYNIGEDQFAEFIKGPFRKYLNSFKKETEAYDIGIWRYLTDRQNFGTVQIIRHKFQYTDLIQNVWNSKVNLAHITPLLAHLGPSPKAYIQL